MANPPANTSCVPSNEDVTAFQSCVGALESCQLVPELVEVYIPPPNTAATSRLPSAEVARQLHSAIGALVCVQPWAKTCAGETTIHPHARSAIAVLVAKFTGMIRQFHEPGEVAHPLIGILRTLL